MDVSATHAKVDLLHRPCMAPSMQGAKLQGAGEI
jgi:hypothetical protein